MATEKAREILTALKEKGLDEAWAAKAANAKTEEEKLEITVEMAKEAGCDVTAEELKTAMNARTEKENGLSPLEDDDLAGVAGGTGDEPPSVIFSKCPKCESTAPAVYTGVKVPFLGLIVFEYRCSKCEETYNVTDYELGMI